MDSQERYRERLHATARIVQNQLGESVTHSKFERKAYNTLREIEFGCTAALVREHGDEDEPRTRTIIAVWGPIDEQDGKWTGKEGWIRLRE